MKLCEQVLLYQKGELELPEKQAFEQHLLTCAACRKELKFLEKLDEALLPPAAPADLVDRVFAKTSRRPKICFPYKRVLAIAATAIIGVVVWLDRSAQHTEALSFDRQELVAYVQYQLDETYQGMEADLGVLEEDY